MLREDKDTEKEKDQVLFTSSNNISSDQIRNGQYRRPFTPGSVTSDEVKMLHIYIFIHFCLKKEINSFNRLLKILNSSSQMTLFTLLVTPNSCVYCMYNFFQICQTIKSYQAVNHYFSTVVTHYTSRRCLSITQDESVSLGLFTLLSDLVCTFTLCGLPNIP